MRTGGKGKEQKERAVERRKGSRKRGGKVSKGGAKERKTNGRKMCRRKDGKVERWKTEREGER